MSNRDYENYNRSYSSRRYHNIEERRFGQTESSKFYEENKEIDSEEDDEVLGLLASEEDKEFAEHYKSLMKAKLSPEEEDKLASRFLLYFVIAIACCIVFPICSSIIYKSEIKKKIISWFEHPKEEYDKITKTPLDLEAEKFGLQSQEYVALKDLSAADIFRKLKEDSLKVEEKIFLAMKAIEFDDVECLRNVINSGCDKDTTDDNGASFLYIAVKNNKQKCMRFLIDSGANIKAETKDGDTILHAAAYNGNFDVVKTAIMAGIPVDKLGAGKKTPLYRAAQANQGHMCRMLVLAGAQRLPRYSNVTEDLDLKHFFQTGKGYWSPTTNSNTKSKFRGNQEPDREEEEKAKWAKVSRIISEGRLSDLLKEVPNPKDFENMSAYGLPPVCVAAKSGQIEMLKYLQRIGCSMQEIDSDSGKSALHFGAQSGNEEVVDYLLANTYINVNMQDDFNSTALHYSILAPLPYATIRLLKEGANPDIRNLRLQTPLHMAVEKNNILGCKLLIENGANINQQDYAGNTAFHYAAMKSNSKGMLDVFYDHMGELDTSIKNNEGKTARESQRWDYLKYYEEHYR